MLKRYVGVIRYFGQVETLASSKAEAKMNFARKYPVNVVDIREAKR